MSQKDLEGTPRGTPLEQGPCHLPTKGTRWFYRNLGSSHLESHGLKTHMLAHLPLICTRNWLLPCLAPGKHENKCLTLSGASALSVKTGSLSGLSHLKIISRFSLLFSLPHAASHRVLPPPLTPPLPEPCLLTMRREVFCFFKQVWTPISFSATWYSLVATVVSHAALLLIWSEVIKEIILTQLRFPEFPEVANSAPRLYFLFQINFVLTPNWEWIFALINFCGKKAGLCVFMPTRALEFLSLFFFLS